MAAGPDYLEQKPPPVQDRRSLKTIGNDRGLLPRSHFWMYSQHFILLYLYRWGYEVN